MRPELKYWRDLTKEEKSRLMIQHDVKSATFEFIENVYNEIKKESEEQLED